MKKKNKFFVNVALIVLSLCIMVYGVYAAKNASLTVTGTIGFQAHGIAYAVTNVAIIDALDADGNTYAISESFNTALNTLNGGEEHIAEADSTLTVSQKTDDEDTSFYFDDLTYSTAEADNIRPIQIVLTVQNRSMFAVQIDYAEELAEDATKRFADADENISYTIEVNYGDGNTSMAPASSTRGEDGGTATVTIFLTLEQNANTYQETYDVVEGEDGITTNIPTYKFAKTFAAKAFNVPLKLDLAAAEVTDPDVQG